MFAAVLTQLGGELGVREQVADLVRAALHRVHQDPRELVDDLAGDPADGAGHNRFLFPKTFGDGETKPFLERLLNNDRGSALQSIDLQRRPGRKVQDDDVGVVAGRVHDFLQHYRAFRIVGGAAAGQNQLAVNVLLDQLVGLDHAHRIFQAIEAGNLGQDRARTIDTEIVANFIDITLFQVPVFLRQRIDRRIKKILRYVELASKRRGREDRSVILLDHRFEEVPYARVRVGKI